MSTSDDKRLEELQKEFNDLDGTYGALFAGKPRATRDLAALDDILAGLERIEAEASKLEGGSTLAQSASQSLNTYRQERDLISETQAQGDKAVRGAQLATWANFVFDEYFRHYAGKPRGSRDIERMKEMIAELEAIGADMDDLVEKHPDLESTHKDIEAVDANLKMYKEELNRIVEARRSGSREERIDSLANAANDQFQVYQALFAGKSRLTRRPGLIKRMIRNLEGILNGMRDINAKPPRSEANQRNIRIVQDNIKMYRDELVKINAARAAEDEETLAGNLGGAANAVMDEYRKNFAGFSRDSRDLGLLSALCDSLYEIAIQMRVIHEKNADLEMNNRNLQIVKDTLILYNSEYRLIQQAKEDAKGPRA
jgi:hypothetical protein